MPHFTVLKVQPAVPSPPLVVWLLSMTTYMPSRSDVSVPVFLASNVLSLVCAVK
ncbi:hypothetical protein PMIN01_08111 [Paraphaeosphaeria minitans]|uniref:Uncharacterized protein n=1 Tax=Paraphaeosphaeria minitans TaxID=565426 RepID=A0A9P6GET7_9PLEO|nr:hypothetical protein PMIN01_13492 [Paraphaeosphaeria minitans]KAF9730021.1 hypothetical protein PMIN01_11954 [Paraphaeosphaeria minitans]KAF9733768.1 hypothetical protein PMIN01_08111 [Paraphaeosphaeria minitans]